MSFKLTFLDISLDWSMEWLRGTGLQSSEKNRAVMTKTEPIVMMPPDVVLLWKSSLTLGNKSNLLSWSISYNLISQILPPQCFRALGPDESPFPVPITVPECATPNPTACKFSGTTAPFKAPILPGIYLWTRCKLRCFHVVIRWWSVRKRSVLMYDRIWDSSSIRPYLTWKPDLLLLSFFPCCCEKWLLDQLKWHLIWVNSSIVVPLQFSSSPPKVDATSRTWSSYERAPTLACTGRTWVLYERIVGCHAFIVMSCSLLPVIALM